MHPLRLWRWSKTQQEAELEAKISELEYDRGLLVAWLFRRMQTDGDDLGIAVLREHFPLDLDRAEMDQQWAQEILSRAINAN